MSALEQIILSWFLNAAWALPVCFFCCWLFLRLDPNLAAGIRHRLWLAALSLGFLAPFGAFLGLWGDSKTMRSEERRVGKEWRYIWVYEEVKKCRRGNVGM